jgi:hypothetical protein
MMGVALILALRFNRWSAWALLALFAVQFPITSTTGRLVLCGSYAVLAVAALIVNRRHVLPTLAAPFTPARDGGDPRSGPGGGNQRGGERLEILGAAVDVR